MYYNIFNYEFNISFVYRRTDICDTCEKQQAEIKEAELSQDKEKTKSLKIQHELHVRKADVFYVQTSAVSENAKALGDNCDTAVIAIDFQNNLPIPLTGVSQEYYKKQLWLHNFCIHDNVNNCATMYIYAEHYAAKRPNEVILCLNHYITGLPARITKLHIFADNCFSQNKNRYLITYLHVISNCLLHKIYVHFPLPGHSRMPCDRDFGRIKKRDAERTRLFGRLSG